MWHSHIISLTSISALTFYKKYATIPTIPIVCKIKFPFGMPSPPTILQKLTRLHQTAKNINISNTILDVYIYFSSLSVCFCTTLLILWVTDIALKIKCTFSVLFSFVFSTIDTISFIPHFLPSYLLLPVLFQYLYQWILQLHQYFHVNN